MRLSYRMRKKLKYLLILLVPLLLGLATFYTFNTITGKVVHDVEKLNPFTEGLIEITSEALNLEGYTEVSVEALPGGIILKSNCTGVPIQMSNLKSFSIKRGLESTLDIRPNYHDLTYDLITHYGGEVVMAKISRLKNDFYYADLFIQEGTAILHLDSRPSDAVGIATRFQAPIYVHNNLLEKQGRAIC